MKNKLSKFHWPQQIIDLKRSNQD